MKKLLSLLLVVLVGFTASAQTKGYLKYDSLFVGTGSGTVKFLIPSSNVSGFMKNTGNGIINFSAISIADVTNLQATLGSKSDTNHTHVIAEVTLLQDALDNKAPLVHSHIIGDVTGLQTALNAKLNISDSATMLSTYLRSATASSTYAPLASPTFSGVPAAPTAAAGTQTSQIATTNFVTTADNLKANLASPTFTGTPTLPTGTIGVTQTAGNSTTALATTAFVTTADALKANLASPTFTGTPTLPTGTIGVTQTAGNSTTALATTAFVTTADALKANLASPTFTGTPTLPTGTIATTQTAGNSSTAIATTAFVTTANGLNLKYTDSAAMLSTYLRSATAATTYQPLDADLTTLAAVTSSTVGRNVLALTNPSAITFLRVNADNSVSALDAATFRTAIGAGTGGGSVSTVSVTSANGFAGTVATATSTPAITISTSVTGLLKGNGTAISAATSGTDYSAGTSALATGILKSTTTTGALTIAVAADFPTLNQNTTGSAATLTSSRNIQGVAFNGSANIDIINGTGFVKAVGTTLSYDNSTYLTTTSAASTYQPLDADLTTIAGLTATTDNFIVGVTSAWASRTPAQVKTTLALNLVENTALSTWSGSTNITTLGTIATGTVPLARIGSLGTGVATFLGTPSSANLIAALTDETGTGAAVFAASPTLTGTVTAAAITTTGKLTTTLTTAQQRWAYDASNYAEIAVASAGHPVFDATGTSPRFNFKDPLEIVTGVGDGTTNEYNAFRLRHSATDGNSMLLSMGANNTAHGGLNQGYGYISATYWGGSDNNPLWLQPKGGQVQVGTLTGYAGSNWKLFVRSDVGIEAPSQIGDTLGGKVAFTTGGANAPVYIQSVFDKAQWYQSMGLTFGTSASADISGATGTERMRITGDGNVGIGIGSGSLGSANIAARLHVVSTTEQVRFGYDGSNYLKATVASTGATTIDAVGSGTTAITFSDSVILSSQLKAINLNTSATTADSALYVNRSTGYLEMRKLPTAGSGTVTSASVVTANGFQGSVATATTTPAITLQTSISGMLKGSSNALVAATSGTDYSAGTSALATGILKSTTTTGALTIAVAADFPTLNQNTTGSAATLTTSRNIQGVAFNGSANIDIINGTGFVKATGTTISYDNSTYLTTSSAASTYQPLDADLTTIAGLTATTDNFIVGVASAWASRTPAQVKTTLALNNVENTALSTWSGSTAITTLGTISTGTIPLANISGHGTGIQTFLGTPSSANLASAITNETGTGNLVFSASPTFTGNITAAKITLSDSIVTTGLIKALNLGTSGTATDSALAVNRTSGMLEMRKLNAGGTIDATPTNGSTNAVQSDGVFDALALKANIASPVFTGVTYSARSATGISSGIPANTLFYLENNSATANNINFWASGTSTASSGITSVFSFTPTFNETGTAGNNVVFISPYYQATGSGTKYLLNIGTNTAANAGGTHSIRMSLDATGNLFVGGNISNATVSGTEFNYLDGLTGDIQPQINAKVDTGRTITIFGAATETQSLGANRTYYPKPVGLVAMQALGSDTKAQIVGVETSANITTFHTMVDGTRQFMAIYLPEPTTLTGVKFYQRTSGVYTADNTNAVALYTISGTTLTQVAVSTNNGNLWKGTSGTWQKEPFATPYVAAAGVYYVALIWNASATTTAPDIGAAQPLQGGNINTGDLGTNIFYTARQTSQTSLPSPTFTMSSASVATERIYVGVY